MFRRYLLPCALIMAVALASGLIAYKAAKKVQFRASCFIQVEIHNSGATPQTPEQQQFANQTNSHELQLAIATGAFAQVAKTLKIRNLDLGVIAVQQAAGQPGTFTVAVLNKDRARATVVANTTCSQLVSSVKGHRDAEQQANIKAIQARITSLQKDAAKVNKIPAKKRTVEQKADLKAKQDAILNNATLIAAILSRPPDEVGVVVPAGQAKLFDKRSIGKNLLIAFVAGLLACFTVVLVGETLADRRRRIDAMIARGGGGEE